MVYLKAKSREGREGRREGINQFKKTLLDFQSTFLRITKY